MGEILRPFLMCAYRRTFLKGKSPDSAHSGKDIAEEFLWERNGKEKKTQHLSDEEKKIFKALGSEKSLDELIMETKMNGSVILAVLTNLKIKELVYEIAGGKSKGV